MKTNSPAAGLGASPKPGDETGTVALFVAVAALYFAREILIPFAFALTLTFLLTPAVTLVQRLRTGRVVAVLLTVLASAAVCGGLGWVIADQLVDVANQLPLYRQTSPAKVEGFQLPAT